MHLDEVRLQRLLHGELSSLEEKGAREHLTECGECSRRFAAMEREEKAVGDLQSMTDALRSHRPGDVVEIRVLRAGAERRLTITLGQRGG